MDENQTMNIHHQETHLYNSNINNNTTRAAENNTNQLVIDLTLVSDDDDEQRKEPDNKVINYHTQCTSNNSLFPTPGSPQQRIPNSNHLNNAAYSIKISSGPTSSSSCECAFPQSSYSLEDSDIEIVSTREAVAPSIPQETLYPHLSTNRSMPNSHRYHNNIDRQNIQSSTSRNTAPINFHQNRQLHPYQHAHQPSHSSQHQEQQERQRDHHQHRHHQVNLSEEQNDEHYVPRSRHAYSLSLRNGRPPYPIPQLLNFNESVNSPFTEIQHTIRSRMRARRLQQQQDNLSQTTGQRGSDVHRQNSVRTGAMNGSHSHRNPRFGNRNFGVDAATARSLGILELQILRQAFYISNSNSHLNQRANINSGDYMPDEEFPLNYEDTLALSESIGEASRMKGPSTVEACPELIDIKYDVTRRISQNNNNNIEEQREPLNELIKLKRGLDKDVICVDDHDDQNENEKSFIEQDECIICLVEFVHDETLKKLPCGHIFHKECIIKWVSQTFKCPICRASVRTIH